jgi:CPA1 family monovalent cation:H+ antiporter
VVPFFVYHLSGAVQNMDVIVVALFAIATAVAIVVRRLLVPYTVGLVLAGILLGTTRLFAPPPLTKELLFTVFLPGLLFEAAFHLDFSRFWRSKVTIAALAVPGVIASIALTAALLMPAVRALHFVQNFSFIHAVVFGAVVAATDPIAVVAVFKQLGVPPRLALLVEGESLLNDGTSVVFFGLILSVASGNGVSVAGAGVEFMRVVGGGFLLGGALGLGLAQVIRRVDEAMIEITLTTLAAYGSFVLAEHLHVSGVIATVTAGMICGNYAARSGMSPSTRLAVETFWEYLAFALNSMVFLLIGFEVNLPVTVAAWKAVLAGFIALTVARGVVVTLVSLATRRSGERVPARWAAVLTWGGLRGALSMVLALSLGRGFPHRDVIISMTFGVVVLSILVQGFTMAPLLRLLGVVREARERRIYDLHRGEILAVRAALASLDQVARKYAVAPDLASLVGKEYEDRLRSTEAGLGRYIDERADIRDEVLARMKRYLGIVERNAVAEAARNGFIAEGAAQELTAKIDGRLATLPSTHPADD